MSTTSIPVVDLSAAIDGSEVVFSDGSFLEVLDLSPGGRQAPAPLTAGATARSGAGESLSWARISVIRRSDASGWVGIDISE